MPRYQANKPKMYSEIRHAVIQTNMLSSPTDGQVRWGMRCVGNDESTKLVWCRSIRVMPGSRVVVSSHCYRVRPLCIALKSRHQNWILQRALFDARASLLRLKCLYPTSLLNVFIYRGKQIRFDVLRCNAWAKINGLSTRQYMIMQSRVDQKNFKISDFKLFILPSCLYMYLSRVVIMRIHIAFNCLYLLLVLSN